MTDVNNDTEDLAATLEREVNACIEPSLLRITAGLPNRELKLMVSEATECETALLEEIRLLEEAIKARDKTTKDEVSLSESDKKALETILESEFTPIDRHFTVSALLGRLREPLSLPLPPNASAILAQRQQQEQQQQQQQQSKKKKSSSGTPVPSAEEQKETERRQSLKLLERQKALLELDSHVEYHREHAEPNALLSLWKRISSHRTAAVFRRPVNAREAPGYSERILFPIDLSLIRKMIAARIIVTYSGLHQHIGLICHNCVKFNGRASDYGIVTREFEAFVDECMLSVVNSADARQSEVRETVQADAPP